MLGVRRLIFTFILAAAAVTAPAVDAESALKNTITVNASGFVIVKPDRAEISAGVVSRGPSAAKALNKNTAQVRKLFKVLSEFSVPTADVQTVNFSVSPRFRARDKRGPRRIVGYRVVNQVLIIVRDLDLLGHLLDDLIKQGSNRVNGIRFSVSNASQIADDARRKAIANAKIKAKTLASAANVKLGKVVRIVETRETANLPRRMLAAPASAVPIALGERKVSANLIVTYEID